MPTSEELRKILDAYKARQKIEEPSTEEYNNVVDAFSDYGPPLPLDYKQPQEIDPINILNKASNRQPGQAVTGDSQVYSSPMAKEPAKQQVSTPQEDKELLDAMNRRNDLQFMSNLSQAGAKIGRAIAGVKDKDYSFYDNLRKQAEQPISDVKLKREQASVLYKLGTEKELNDPNSALAQSARDFASKYGIKLPEGLSYNAMKDVMHESRLFQQFEEMVAARKEMARAGREERDLKRKELQSRFDEKQVESYQTKARQHPLYKAAVEAEAALPDLENVLQDAVTKGGQSVNILGVKLAKFVGERGVLTENDVKRYVQNPQLLQTLLSRGSRDFSGRISTQDYKNLRRLMEGFKENIEKNKNKAYDELSKALAQNKKVSFEDARKVVNPYSLDTEQYSPEIEARIQNVMNANPQASRDQVIQALKNAKKL